MLRRSFSKALANKEPLLCDSSVFSDDTNSDSDTGGSGMVPMKSLPKLRPPRLIAKTCKQYRQRSHDTDGTPLLSVERIAYTYKDVPMELRRGYYRTDTHHYHNTLS